MKVVLFADGAVGRRIAAHCLGAYPEDLLAVVTTGANDITAAARRRGVRAIAFEDEAGLLDVLGPDGFDVGILAWWPLLVRRPVLSLARRAFFNTHPSLLPHNRGKHYNFWALVEEAPFGVTIHEVVEQVDAGDVVAQRAIPTDWTDTGQSLYEKAQAAMVDLFVDTYPAIRAGTVEGRRQDLSRGSHHHARELDVASRIDLDAPTTARTLLNTLRARTFPPHPACRFEADGDTYEVTVQIKRSQR